MTSIVNRLLIPNNINPNRILVIRPYANGIRPDNSSKAIHGRLSTTHNFAPMFFLFKLQPYSGSCDHPDILRPGLC